MKRFICSVFLGVVVFSSQSLAWNGTGHQIVARIAWDNMTETARQNVVKLLMQAPANACLRDLFPTTGDVQQRPREFFVRVATWPDVVRPRDSQDTRPCIQFHQRDWHFVDHFWKGVSGSPNTPPTDLPKPIAPVNAVERLLFLRAASINPALPAQNRAMSVSWLMHLVGDIHQPLHTSGRVTQFPNEQDGDGGGNDFKLAPDLSLHSYWDGIVDRAHPKQAQESFPLYIERVAKEFELANSKTSFTQPLPNQFDKWALESLENAKSSAYPQELLRNQMPDANYQGTAFRIAQVEITEAGYRLADLLNCLFG
jgi:hypothetical protein